MRTHITARAAACGAAFMLTLTAAGQLPVSAASSAVSAPVFSQESCFYDAAFDLTLTAPDDCKIYYTLDGSEPTGNSRLYDGAISVCDRTPEANVISDQANPHNPPDAPVDKATIVRAAAYDASGRFSETVTKTYFIGCGQRDYLTDIPVVSLVTDPDHLFNEETGIYVDGNSGARQEFRLPNYMQKGREWERPAHFTVFENGKAVYSANTGIRIHGNSSSMSAQKSFKLYSRSEYGTKKFAYDFFGGTARDVNGERISSFDHMILRNGGNDSTLKIRDRLCQEMAAGRSFGTQAKSECVVFLDGEFWGLYNFTEKLNESYLAAHYHVKKDSVCLIKDPLEYIEGDVKGLDDFRDLIALAESDLSGADAYDRVAAVIDIKGYAEYMATELLIANIDFNNNNFALWKTDTADSSNPYADGKWRFLLYDTEESQGRGPYCAADTDMFARMQQSEAWNIRLLFSLLESSPRFRTEFTEAFYSVCDENFNSERVLKRADELLLRYRKALEKSYDRFAEHYADSETPTAESQLNEDFSSLRTFWEDRADYAKSHLVNYLQTVVRPGDVNGDAQVDAADAVLLRDLLLGRPDAALADRTSADLNADGRLSAADLSALKQLLRAA